MLTFESAGIKILELNRQVLRDCRLWHSNRSNSHLPTLKRTEIHRIRPFKSSNQKDIAIEFRNF